MKRRASIGKNIQPASSRPQLNDQIRLLVNKACAVRAGVAQMTLADWRDVERELIRRLKHKRSMIHRMTVY